VSKNVESMQQKFDNELKNGTHQSLTRKKKFLDYCHSITIIVNYLSCSQIAASSGDFGIEATVDRRVQVEGVVDG